MENKLIFQAEIDDKNNLVVKVFSKYVPMIAYAQKMLDIEVDKIIIDEKIKSSQSPIIHPAKAHGLINFLRKGK